MKMIFILANRLDSICLREFTTNWNFYLLL